MKRVVICLAVLLLAGLTGWAGPLVNPPACPNSGLTLNMFLAGGMYASGCIDQDKYYYAFSYSNPVNTISPSNVTVSIGFADVGAGVEQHTVSLQPATGFGAWTGTVNFGFVAEILNPQTPRKITDVNLVLSALPVGTRPNTSIATTVVTPDGGLPLAVTSTATLPGAIDGLFADMVSIQVSATPGVSQVGGRGSITGISVGIVQTEIPEPGTLGGIGSGLLGLALVGRRWRR